MFFLIIAMSSLWPVIMLSSNGGIFLGHGVCEGLLYVVIKGFYIGKAPAHKCCWVQCCTIICFIPWQLLSVPLLQKT